ncbi:T cell receptor alpha chain MC.7.G5-like isoform X2 [Epinephelus fuscoguttatus]|uniref:T cell receptor alpha chain MC.7.G5-like isoform X2 n=1 Tax=Epinephelus fuscoguttatus TaxID=293821 RepID=UPI0020D031D8|nr:T cell receptor alpha chain MC.7.G5-like isoform X2 [Epinephelus fuscoguttatus]
MTITCCVNINNNKLVFGSGIKLIVTSYEEESKPSYYKLQTIPSNDEKSNLTVCLATGFNRHNASAFNKTEAVLIKDDSLYNQVTLLSPQDECAEADSGGSPTCEDKLEPDAKVNLMSLTIMGLRLLFIKTIVFNVLMTLRLWISQ